MLRGLGSKLTYSNVMVTILAFIVLGGGTAAAVGGSGTIFSEDIADQEVKQPDIAQNAVTAQAIGEHQVKKSDIAGNAITSRQVRPNSLSGQDIREGSLTGIAAGVQGAIWINISGYPNEFRPAVGFTNMPSEEDDYSNGFVAPVSFVARDLSVQINGGGSISSGDSLQIVFMLDGGTRTSLACTISGPNQFGCNDGSDTATVQAGQSYAFALFPSTSAWAGRNLNIGWRAVTP